MEAFEILLGNIYLNIFLNNLSLYHVMHSVLLIPNLFSRIPILHSFGLENAILYVHYFGPSFGLCVGPSVGALLPATWRDSCYCLSLNRGHWHDSRLNSTEKNNEREMESERRIEWKLCRLIGYHYLGRQVPVGARSICLNASLLYGQQRKTRYRWTYTTLSRVVAHD